MKKGMFFILVLSLFLYVLSPFFTALMMGAVFAVLLMPVSDWLRAHTKLSDTFIAILVTLGVTFVFLLPAGVVIVMGAKAGIEQIVVFKNSDTFDALQTAIPHTQKGVFQKLLRISSDAPFVRNLITWFSLKPEDVMSGVAEGARQTAVFLGNSIRSWFSEIPAIAMNFAITVMALFFFLLDGKVFVEFLKRLSVYEKEQTDALTSYLGEMCRSVVLASVFSGLAQALFMSIACAAVGTGNIMLIGFMVFLCSFVPIVGSGPVNIVLAVFQFVDGSNISGWILLAAAVMVGIIDNLIRPLVLQGRANLHPMLAFVSALGGLQVIGVSGIFLGPIIAGLCVTVAEFFASNPAEKI